MDDTFLQIAKALDLIPCKFYKKHKFLHYLHLTLTLGLYLWLLVYIFQLVLEFIHDPDMSLMMIFNAACIVLVGIFVYNTILQNILQQASKFEEMCEHSKAFDALLPEERRRHKKYTKIYALVYYGVYFIYRASIMLSSTWPDVIADILITAAYVYFFCMQSVIWSVLGTLRNQIKNLNCYVESFAHSKNILNVITVQDDCLANFQENIHIGSQLVLLNAKIVQIFNDIFGFNIFILLINVMLQLLMTLKLFLLIGFAIYQYPIFVQFVYITAELLWMIKLSQEISSDCRTTTRLAYEALAHAENDAERDEMQEFIKQTEILRPVCSAKGYCTLNYNLLFQMMELIITYIVVLLQMQ